MDGTESDLLGQGHGKSDNYDDSDKMSKMDCSHGDIFNDQIMHAEFNGPIMTSHLMDSKHRIL